MTETLGPASTATVSNASVERQSPDAEQEIEGPVAPADSNISDVTQQPQWLLQRWAAMILPQSNGQSQASMQQFMSNITAAMQQAQREVCHTCLRHPYKHQEAW